MIKGSITLINVYYIIWYCPSFLHVYLIKFASSSPSISKNLIRISANACKIVSFDIPTQDNIHKYLCNNPIFPKFVIPLLPMC